MKRIETIIFKDKVDHITIEAIRERGSKTIDVNATTSNGFSLNKYVKTEYNSIYISRRSALKEKELNIIINTAAKELRQIASKIVINEAHTFILLQHGRLYSQDIHSKDWIGICQLKSNKTSKNISNHITNIFNTGMFEVVVKRNDEGSLDYYVRDNVYNTLELQSLNIHREYKFTNYNEVSRILRGRLA